MRLKFCCCCVVVVVVAAAAAVLSRCGSIINYWPIQTLYSKRIFSASGICIHFLPCMKNVPKRTKMHLNEVGLTNTEICKKPIQLRQPPIS